MNIKELKNNKKFKNTMLTLLEIMLVAGLIFGVLMFIQSKINKDASTNGVVKSKTEAQKKEEKLSDNYYIEINKKKSALIVYQYTEDKTSKKVVKIFKASIGKKIKTGSYKTTTKYNWINIGKSWYQKNTGFGTKYWIQSVAYRDKYPYTMKKTAYRSIGKKWEQNKGINLYSGDATWIMEHIKTGTKIVIIKGNKNDQLPMSIQTAKKLYKGCGWDPTDTNKNNPYKKIKNGQIVIGESTVYVEKGKSPEYLSNILALDENGKNLTDKLKYSEIDNSEIGKYSVNYSVKTKSKKKLKSKMKIKIVDTTPPVLTSNSDSFVLKVDSLDDKKFRTESTRNKIIQEAIKHVTCNESGVVITANCPEKEELQGNIKDTKNENIITVSAIDKSKNVGDTQIICKITLTDKAMADLNNNKKSKTNKK